MQIYYIIIFAISSVIAYIIGKHKISFKELRKEIKDSKDVLDSVKKINDSEQKHINDGIKEVKRRIKKYVRKEDEEGRENGKEGEVQ